MHRSVRLPIPGLFSSLFPAADNPATLLNLPKALARALGFALDRAGATVHAY